MEVIRLFRNRESIQLRKSSNKQAWQKVSFLSSQKVAYRNNNNFKFKDKITLSGFPAQTGESVTDLDLTASPCSIQNGFSDITIPGIGDGYLLVILQNHRATQRELPKIVIYLVVACVTSTV
jgi:hypothetical protein